MTAGAPPSVPESDEPTVLPRGTILVGDARQRLAELPETSVDCVITSPPYFGLRDYGQPGQLGAEACIAEWAQQLLVICRELARVLKPTGALWLNLGDGYSRHPREGANTKSLLLGPERVALALTGDGWLLRNKVVWAKTNPMPASVGDRLSCGYEVVLLLTRQRRYYFDLDSIRIPAETPLRTARPARTGHYPPDEATPRLHGGTASRVDLNHGLAAMKAAGQDHHPLGKNPGDVWSLPTANYRGAHFATFPMSLVERPLLSTCPARTCVSCGQPWQRARQWRQGQLLAVGSLVPDCACQRHRSADGRQQDAPAWRPGVVLDPFIGAGTVALVAEQHGRDWIGIELNPEAYSAILIGGVSPQLNRGLTRSTQLS
ncbi:MAG: DNA-methyltransferase [Pseudonocardia sp.]